MAREKPIRVLVIDDSPANRRAITELLEAAPDLEVIDRAGDGHEGLQKAIALRPEVITLDLEMPRLDGYAFLRLLQAKAPTPVIVLSSYAHPSDVFKALELGAYDFVAKPGKGGKGSLEAVRAELLEKVRAVRQVKAAPPAPPTRAPPARPSAPARLLPQRLRAPVVVAVGASTGGPPAVQRLVEVLKGTPVCLLVAQHMPALFTLAFAQRLDKAGALRVSEAKDGDVPRPGHAYIAPGGAQLELVRRGDGLVLATPAAGPDDRHAPSVDRLFASVARALGKEALGVVLTGMGNDGALGARAIAKAGGAVWAESAESAVIPGMPQAAVEAGGVQRVLSLEELARALALRVTRGA